VKRSLSAISTVNASFAEDVAAYAAAGFDAIGLWEMKLPADDAANIDLIRSHGLTVSNCVPTVPSFLPLAIPGMEGPPDTVTRIDAICASITRLAAYEPECVVCLSGPLGGRSDAEGRAIVVDGLCRAAAAATEAGVRLGFEPVHPAQRDTAPSPVPFRGDRAGQHTVEDGEWMLQITRCYGADCRLCLASGRSRFRAVCEGSAGAGINPSSPSHSSNSESGTKPSSLRGGVASLGLKVAIGLRFR
jgi:hypothetical protein